MNDAFDILNCRSKFSKSTYNQALSSDTYNKYLCFTKKFEEYVYGLTHIDGTRVVNSLRKTEFVGLVWGLKNLLSYYNLLKQNKYENMGYALSYKLSQDHTWRLFLVLLDQDVVTTIILLQNNLKLLTKNFLSITM